MLYVLCIIQESVLLGLWCLGLWGLQLWCLVCYIRFYITLKNYRT